MVMVLMLQACYAMLRLCVLAMLALSVFTAKIVMIDRYQNTFRRRRIYIDKKSNIFLRMSIKINK